MATGQGLPANQTVVSPDLPQAFLPSFTLSPPSGIPHFSAGLILPLVKGLAQAPHTLRNVSSSPLACAFCLEAEQWDMKSVVPGTGLPECKSSLHSTSTKW